MQLFVSCKHAPRPTLYLTICFGQHEFRSGIKCLQLSDKIKTKDKQSSSWAFCQINERQMHDWVDCSIFDCSLSFMFILHRVHALRFVSPTL